MTSEDAHLTREGYLVIADIAGYTAFFTGTELEHAESIITELTTLIRERLTPPLRFVKLEGDAVLCYANADTIKGAERLVELLEVCYFDFSNLVFNMVRSTTCECAACATIESLDLKFVAHYGSYIVQREHAIEDLVGPDVILAHRLLKNTIEESTGITAYAFLTDACMQRLPQQVNLPGHSETYESFAETSGGVYDLAPVLREMREARREYVSSDEADHQTSLTVPHPPAVLWQYVADPVQRLRWACVMFNHDPDTFTPNRLGRTGTGTKMHCNHGPAEAYREIIDWRPFRYFTTRGITQLRVKLLPARPTIETFEFTPSGETGTQLTWRLRFVERGSLSMLTLRLIRLLFRGGVGYGEAKLRAAMQADLASLPKSE